MQVLAVVVSAHKASAAEAVFYLARSLGVPTGLVGSAAFVKLTKFARAGSYVISFMIMGPIFYNL